MFCKNCGAEMNDDARFCPKCGYDKSGEAPKESVKSKEDNKVQFQLKPKFNWGYKILTTAGVILLWAIIIFLYFISELEEIAIVWLFSSSIPIIVVAVVLIYIAIKLFFEKKQYDALEYNFYNTKVEYIDGFLNKEQKELKYKYIREVTMSQSIVERIFRIGTIKIFTNASSGTVYNNKHNNMYGKNGLSIHCVENVKEKYQKVKEIIDAGTPED